MCREVNAYSSDGSTNLKSNFILSNEVWDIQVLIQNSTWKYTKEETLAHVLKRRNDVCHNAAQLVTREKSEITPLSTNKGLGILW